MCSKNGKVKRRERKIKEVMRETRKEGGLRKVDMGQKGNKSKKREMGKEFLEK